MDRYTPLTDDFTSSYESGRPERAPRVPMAVKLAFLDRMDVVREHPVYFLPVRGTFENPRQGKKGATTPYLIRSTHKVALNAAAHQYTNAYCGLSYGEGSCAYCDARDDGDDRISAAVERFFIPGIQLGIFREYLTDRRRKDGTVITTWNLLTSEAEREELADGIREKRISREQWSASLPKYWELSQTHMDALAGHSRQIREKCRCGGNITTKTFACPQCSAGLHVVKDKLDAKTVQRGLDGALPCKQCKVAMAPGLVCSRCETPSPTRIYDVVLRLQKSGEGKTTVINISSTPAWDTELMRGKMVATLADGLLTLDPSIKPKDFDFAGMLAYDRGASLPQRSSGGSSRQRETRDEYQTGGARGYGRK